MSDSPPPRSMQWSITPSIDFTNQTLSLETKDVEDRITHEVCHLKDKAIRAGLIALGWTPPDQVHENPLFFVNHRQITHPKPPEPWAFPLWKHLHDEHGLILTETEIHEIIRHAAPCAPNSPPRRKPSIKPAPTKTTTATPSPHACITTSATPSTASSSKKPASPRKAN